MDSIDNKEYSDKNYTVYNRLLGRGYASKPTTVGESSAEYDVVNGFFKSVMDETAVANTFTMHLFQIAKHLEIPVLTILDSIKDQDKIGVTAIIAHYLNGMRPNNVLFGVDKVVTPNYFAARNVVI